MLDFDSMVRFRNAVDQVMEWFAPILNFLCMANICCFCFIRPIIQLADTLAFLYFYCMFYLLRFPQLYSYITKIEEMGIYFCACFSWSWINPFGSDFECDFVEQKSVKISEDVEMASFEESKLWITRMGNKEQNYKKNKEEHQLSDSVESSKDSRLSFDSIMSNDVYVPNPICTQCGNKLRPDVMHSCPYERNHTHEEGGVGSQCSMPERQRNQGSYSRNEIEEEKVPLPHDRPIYRGFYAAIGDADIPIEEKIERFKTTIDDFEFLEKQYKCMICITEFRLKDIIVSLPCYESHVYHYACYRAYITSFIEQGKNPICLRCNKNNLDSIKLNDSGVEEAKMIPQFSIGDMVQNTIRTQYTKAKEKITQLKLRIIGNKYLTGNYKCVICLEHFLVGEDIVPLQCNRKHTYHYYCLLNHIRREEDCQRRPQCLKCSRVYLDEIEVDMRNGPSIPIEPEIRIMKVTHPYLMHSESSSF
ncbi:unnamed protein product [Moneuplotes crassus]|uniref:RING-type domain-containing protein n=1 Tax=Euplotes crassus TaxID=5936 RepID=A0AAD1XZ60_EUPCR|nr:unnamed protein product [Moneuplotes crassus]